MIAPWVTPVSPNASYNSTEIWLHSNDHGTARLGANHLGKRSFIILYGNNLQVLSLAEHPFRLGELWLRHEEYVSHAH